MGNVSRCFVLLCLFSSSAVAFDFGEVCDFRPSRILSDVALSAAAVGTGLVGGTAATGSALGLYSVKHAVTGAYMIGSTAGGASGAGTIGIMGGTAGAIGSTASVLLNPFFWAPVITVATTAIVYEGGCTLID